MIDRKVVDNLALLSRLSLTDEEKEAFVVEINQILDYVGQVKDASAEAPTPDYPLRNVLRSDEVVSLDCSEKLLDSAPEREGNFVKVKKILE